MSFGGHQCDGNIDGKYQLNTSKVSAAGVKFSLAALRSKDYHSFFVLSVTLAHLRFIITLFQQDLAVSIKAVLKNQNHSLIDSEQNMRTVSFKIKTQKCTCHMCLLSEYCNI